MVEGYQLYRMIKIKNYINGKLHPSSNQKYLDIFNPSIGKIYGQCHESSNEDLQYAIESAETSFPYWANLNQKKRSDFLFKIADFLEKDLELFAEAESIDNGKPYKLSKSLDIPRSIQNLRFFASIAGSNEKEQYRNEGVVSNILRQPLGIVATISPEFIIETYL